MKGWMRGTVLALVLPLLWACSGDGRRLESPVMTVTVELGPGDLAVGEIDASESVAEDAGGTWSDFLDRARDRCTGIPGGFSMERLAVAVDEAASQGVSGFEDVVDGEASVYFANTGEPTATRVTVGRTSGLTGAARVDMPIVAREADLRALRQRMGSSTFYIGFRADTDRVTDDDFRLGVQVEFQVAALCSGTGFQDREGL